jgi:putative sugar O-methyltransferase
LTERSTFSASLESQRAEVLQSGAYDIYRGVRDWVAAAMDRADAAPSAYWAEEIAGFAYMFEASPLVVGRLREHCYHITGIRSNDYRAHHVRQSRPFARKLEMLRALDRNGLFVPEHRALGGFGHEVDGVRINLDTLKFYEALISMDRNGLLDAFRGQRRGTVLEIGAGWGGMAYQFKTNFPNSTYIIVDLPATMLFSATYLQTLFPSAKIRRLVPGEPLRDHEDADFVFIPNTLLAEQSLPQLDLAFNMVSFQEMTTEQVGTYVATLAAAGCRSLYSLNRERSPYNTQLTAVSSILARHYDLHETHVLPLPYYEFPNDARFATLKRAVRRLIRPRGTAEFYYRHLIGRLRADASRSKP